MPETEILQLTAIGVIFLFAIREFFAFLKTRKSTNGNNRVLEELKIMNQNHLRSIEKGLNEGFDRVIEVINNNDRQMIQLLGEISGRLK